MPSMYDTFSRYEALQQSIQSKLSPRVIVLIDTGGQNTLILTRRNQLIEHHAITHVSARLVLAMEHADP